MGERRKFSREFKAEAVRLVKETGARIEEVSRGLGVRPDMPRRWKRQVEQEGGAAFPASGRLLERDEVMRRLQRPSRRLTMERDILRMNRPALSPALALGVVCVAGVAAVPAGVAATDTFRQ